jgi:hypothetical protein
LLLQTGAASRIRLTPEKLAEVQPKVGQKPLLKKSISSQIVFPWRSAWYRRGSNEGSQLGHLAIACGEMRAGGEAVKKERIVGPYWRHSPQDRISQKCLLSEQY